MCFSGSTTYTLTKSETHQTLHKPRKTELHANDNLTVHTDRHVAVDGKLLGKAGEEIHLAGGMKIVMEAGAELTLKAGGSWITIGPAGVSADGPVVELNCGGSPSKGTGAEPELPEGSVGTEEGSRVSSVPIPRSQKQKEMLVQASEDRKSLCEVCKTP